MRHYLLFLGLTALILVGLACKKPAPALVKPVTPTVEADVPPVPPAPARKRVLETPVWTQTVAVLDVRVSKIAPSTITEDLVLPMTERIEAAFLATGRFEIVERARLEAVKKEMSDTTDALWFDQTTVAKMGKFLGARYLALPTARLEVGVLSSRLDLQVKVIDTETGSAVQSFAVKTTSSSLSTNSSITSCLERIRLELADALAPVYPAQAMIIHSPKTDIFWAEGKQVKVSFRPGQKIRILEAKDVANPIKGTTGVFTVEAGRGYVQSVEAYGIVVKARGVKAEEGWLIEVLP